MSGVSSYNRHAACCVLYQTQAPFSGEEAPMRGFKLAAITAGVIVALLGSSPELSAVEDAGFLCLELVFGQDAGRLQLAELG